MIDLNSVIVIFILNANGLNRSLKGKHGQPKVDKQDLRLCCLHETNFKQKDISSLRMEKDTLKINGKTAGMATVISNKVDFNSRSVSSDIRNLKCI